MFNEDLFFHKLKGILALCAGANIIYVGYAARLNKSKRRRELFPDIQDFYKSSEAFRLAPESPDEKLSEFIEYATHINKITLKKTAIGVAALILITLLD